MKSSVEDEKLKGKISESDKVIIFGRCNQVIRWLDDNQHAEKEVFESKQKELESIVNRIITKKEDFAGGRQIGTTGKLPGARGPAQDGSDVPQTERLQSDRFGQTTSGENHNKFPHTGDGGTRKKNRGKLSNIAHVCDLAVLTGLTQGLHAVYGTFG
jgi:hypothetical protein